MFNRNTRNRLQVQADNDNQENLKKQIVFFFYILSLIAWSFILPTPIYFLLCGIGVIGAIGLHIFPELDEKLGKVGDWLSSKWSQLINNNTETLAQELVPTPVDHSLIHRRLSQQSIDSNDIEDDSNMLRYDEISIQYGQLFESLLDAIELTQSPVFYNGVRRNNNRYC